MSRTLKYAAPKAKQPRAKKTYKMYFCGNCGVNEVTRPGELCWECEHYQVEIK